MAHILMHPEMRSMQSAVQETLRGPELAIQSITDDNVVLNYRFARNTLVGDKWLCVVVKYAEDDAYVLTAYLTDKPKKGKKLWPNE